MAIKKNKKFIKGISIIEILVVIFILGVSFVSFFTLINFSLRIASLNKANLKANTLAQEAMEAVRNFRDNTSWSVDGLATLSLETEYHPEKTVISPIEWDLVFNKETIDGFDREVVFQKVYRDGDFDIAASGTEDPDTRKAVVTVSWQERGKNYSIVLISYFTNW